MINDHIVHIRKI